jgi:hypothetical protein
MSTRHTGRCLCGAITYECGPPVVEPSLCHCESCRRAAGAHVVAWATVKRDSFRITAGSPRSYTSSPPVTRQFCEHCGTPLTYGNVHWPDTIDVTIATLDQPNSIQPTEHIWMEDALSWDRPNDGLSQYRRGR